MYLGIIFTFIVGLFFLFGILFLNKSKYKEKLSIFTTALAFIVMLGLIFLDLLEEIIEYNNVLMIIPCITGFIILLFLDKLIPHHHHEHTDKHCDEIDHKKHLNHIGIITLIALAIHNIIEGITLYSITTTSIKSGILMMVSIGLHNIPLGFQIGNSLDIKNNKLLIFLLCISSLLGSIIVILFGGLNEHFIGILLSLTFGMLIYILLFELLHEIKINIDKKETLYGIIVGIILLFITSII